MTFATHNVLVSFKGKTTIVHYWADGHGRRVDSYVTSLAQLRVMLHKKFGQRALDLYCVDGGRLRPITNERHLNNALEHTRKGGTLFVQAYEHKDIDFSTSSLLRIQTKLQAAQ